MESPHYRDVRDRACALQVLLRDLTSPVSTCRRHTGAVTQLTGTSETYRRSRAHQRVSDWSVHRPLNRIHPSPGIAAGHIATPEHSLISHREHAPPLQPPTEQVTSPVNTGRSLSGAAILHTGTSEGHRCSRPHLQKRLLKPIGSGHPTHRYFCGTLTLPNTPTSQPHSSLTPASLWTPKQHKSPLPQKNLQQG